MTKHPLMNLASCLVSRIILGVIFIYSGTLKMENPLQFADSIAAYRILPESAINLVAMGLPPFEIACGLLTLIGAYIRIGTLAITSMLTIFVVAISCSIIRGLPITCGCFGGASWLESNPWAAIVRDALLLVLSILVYRHYYFQKAME